MKVIHFRPHLNEQEKDWLNASVSSPNPKLIPGAVEEIGFIQETRLANVVEADQFFARSFFAIVDRIAPLNCQTILNLLRMAQRCDFDFNLLAEVLKPADDNLQPHSKRVPSSLEHNLNEYGFLNVSGDVRENGEPLLDSQSGREVRFSVTVDIIALARNFDDIIAEILPHIATSSSKELLSDLIDDFEKIAVLRGYLDVPEIADQ